MNFRGEGKRVNEWIFLGKTPCLPLIINKMDYGEKTRTEKRVKSEGRREIWRCWGWGWGWGWDGIGQDKDGDARVSAVRLRFEI